MAAAITVTPNNPRVGTAVTISGSGFANATKYRLTLTYQGNRTGFIDVTSDGSGAFSTTVVADEPGSLKVDARPFTEHTGTTTVTATASAGKIIP